LRVDDGEGLATGCLGAARFKGKEQVLHTFYSCLHA
jgi:hypothetical protein